MASLSFQVEAHLISKGKSADEASTITADESQVVLQNDGSGDYIKTWNVSGITKPTDSELTAADTEGTKLQNNLSVRKTRKRTYGDIGDQLDLLYKDLVAGKVDATGEWAKAIKKVKDDNPLS
jgi:hypothetical protein|tara:strand:- start:61 stop:429 length:369 start_codon:yes stop_codon:yes gene_type:complete